MEEEELAVKSLTYNGLFDFKQTYEFIITYLEEQNYFVMEVRRESIVKEDGIHYDIKCDALKKISDYFRYKIGLEIKAIVNKAKAKKDNKTIEIDEGNINITLGAVMLYDYEDRWTGPITKIMREFYDHYVIRNRINKYKSGLLNEHGELIKQVKNFLAMEKLT